MQRSDGISERYLTPNWYISMVRGRYALGDTFFAGFLGAAMIIAPVGFVLAAFVAVAAPDAMGGLILAICVFYAVYLTLLIPAITTLAWQTKNAGGWRWFGIVLAIGISATAWSMVNRYLGAG